MEPLIQQIAGRREEIARADTLLMIAVFLIFTLAIASYVAAVISGKTELHKLTLILVIALPFFVARQEYMIHRPAAWIKLVEQTVPKQAVQTEPQNVPNWETWKDSRTSRWALLPILDILAGFAALYVIYCSGAVLWTDYRQFVVWCIVSLLAGIGACIAAVPLAGQ